MEITTGRTIRWIAGLTATALIAAVGYTALQLGGGEEVRRSDKHGDTDPKFPLKLHAPPGLEEVLEAEATIAEDTPAGRLVAAARAGDAERVRQLLAEGIAPDVEEPKNGHRALHQAAEAGEIEAVEVLLDAGAEVDALDGAGMTALMRAAVPAAVPVGKRLLAGGAEVNARSASGETALTQVVGGSFKRHLLGGASEAAAAELEFARMLLDRGADPNLSSGKDSPLKVLAVAQKAELLALLVERGARVAGDPELQMLGMLPGPIGEALRAAISDAPETKPADKPTTR